MTNYAKNVNHISGATPQAIKATESQKQNNAGGFVFSLDMWSRLDRFLILGADSNTYYSSAKTAINDNYEVIIECIKDDGIRAVTKIVDVSTSGNAPKNIPAVFALAVCAAFGDKIVKEAAFRAMPSVARIATDFFAFINDYKMLGGGFGIVARKGIEAWYSNKEISQAAYQIVKYRQRNGWTHLDALRLAHVKPRNVAEENLYGFAKSLTGKDANFDKGLLPEIAQGYIEAQEATNPSEIVKLVDDYNLPREAIPTHFLNDINVWDSLLQRMPATALIRNLGKMSSIGLLDGGSDGRKMVVDKLSDAEWLIKSRVHPITILNALSVYKKGAGVRGSLTWDAAGPICDALDEAFYSAFDHIEPTGKRTMLALDISGSMGMNWGEDNPSFSLNAREISAAMAMATARVESDHMFTAFTSELSEIDISPRQRLDDVVKTLSAMRMGRTDCAQPMLYALEKKIVIDTFCIYTDNETWFGAMHPFQALNKYRAQVNPNAKLVVVACTPTEFSIADPSDAGMLDVAGFDSNVPTIISNFSRA